MKSLRSSFLISAYTLVELLVSTAVVGMTGGVVYYILNTGMVLFAKNSAINIAHQEARVAVIQMEQDLHAAVSIPQLVDASTPPVAVSGNGPAAGISFQLYAAGPFQVTPNTAGYAQGATTITVRMPSTFTPVQYQRLIIPTHQVEVDVDHVISSSAAPSPALPGLVDRKIAVSQALATNVNTRLNTQSGTMDINIVCFFTDRVSYAVHGSQLYYFGRQKTTNPKVLANDLTTATPFSIPATPLGAPYYRFVAAINLSTADNTSNNRHFRAANMFLNAMEPYRARLCTYQ